MDSELQQTQPEIQFRGVLLRSRELNISAGVFYDPGLLKIEKKHSEAKGIREQAAADVAFVGGEKRAAAYGLEERRAKKQEVIDENYSSILVPNDASDAFVSM